MNVVLREPSPACEADHVPLQEKVALLRRPSTHGGGVAAVGLVETHMSLLFLAGDTVYKLKKPVVHPPLDFGTLAARERACREEVRLNRRLAPDVYLGVSAITRAAEGRIGLDGKGEPVEWLVRMRRLPSGRTLDSLIESGRIDARQVDDIAGLLSRFYACAELGRLDADQYVQQLRSEHAISRRVIADFDNVQAGPLPEEVQRFLDRDHDLLRQRVATGRLVDGHGDLRPEHVWLNTPPVIIDCLEFSERLRQVDPFDEITYLGLECARLGAAWIGPQLHRRLSAALGDRPDPRLLRFYAGYRACVRARLALGHLAEPQPRQPGRWRPLALDYLRLGTEFSPVPSVP